MEARVHRSPAEFREAAWPLLSSDPVRNTVPLTAMAHIEDATVMITLVDNGNVVGSVVRLPPYPLLVTVMPVEAAALVAETVHGMEPSLASVGRIVDRAEAFKAAWTGLTGTKAEQTLATRLFELRELKVPAVEGEARVATEDDLPLMTEWRRLFMVEALPAIVAERADSQARRSLEPGNINIFWEVDGKPASFAAARGPISGMVRIGPVYTPPELRGHGYASAVTAAASQWAIDQGTEHVLLSTDLANETTNRIYPRIGYEPVEDFIEYSFS